MADPIKGLKTHGNINLYDRPHVFNPDDNTSSTVSSMSFGSDKGETLVPTVTTGRHMSDFEAKKEYDTTGQHLGIFDTPENATLYSKQLHNAYQQHKLDVPLASSRQSVNPQSLSQALKGLIQYGPYTIPGP